MASEADQRRADAHHGRIERGKHRRRFDDAVARDYAEGLSICASADRLQCTKKQVEKSRAWQGLTGRASAELLEAQLAHSKKQRQFDAAVLVDFAKGLSAADSAALLRCAVWEVHVSRAVLGLATGRSSYRQGVRTGRLNTRAAIEGMRVMFRLRNWLDHELSAT